MRLVLVVSPLIAALLAGAAHASAYPGVGRDATPAEIKAWDIDVRPDFQGLPPGSGSVADGEDVWIASCTSCHGDFGDANHVFAPLIGNTTKEDIKSGHVAALTKPGVRTTIMKVSTVSTLWDFINRAMPWNAPKSLTTDQVYAVLAYMLNLAEVIPQDYVLSDKNIAEVQLRMPNRNGMTRDHGMWAINGKPDTHNTRCMKNCAKDVRIESALPDYARNAHGDLAQQNRTFGPVRGIVTAEPTTIAPTATATPKPARTKTPAATSAVTKAPTEVLSKYGCSGCHAIDHRLVGPGFAEIAAKYKGLKNPKVYFGERIRKGGVGVWGPIPMPPVAAMTDAELDAVVNWLMSGAMP